MKPGSQNETAGIFRKIIFFAGTFVLPHFSLIFVKMAEEWSGLEPMHPGQLKFWLYKQGFHKADPPYTHLSLAGGKFAIPAEQEAAFLKQYARELSMDIHPYFCEYRTAVFPMLCDTDVDDDHAWTEAETLAYVRGWQQVVSEVFPSLSDRGGRVIVSVCGGVKMKDNDPNKRKTGIHLVWPELLLDQSKAVQLRHMALQWLERSMPRAAGRDAWDQVVDECVLTTNGLRMIGSYKTVKCPACKGKPPQDRKKARECMFCQGQLKVEEKDRVYRVHMVLDKRGEPLLDELERCVSDTLYCVQQNSIRRPHVQEPIDLEVLPIWYHVKKQKLKVQDESHEQKVVIAPDRAVEEHHDLTKHGEVISMVLANKDIFTVVQRIIRRQRHYEQVELRQVFQAKNSDGRFLYVISTKSHFCMNKQGEHSHEHVYFLLKCNGRLEQRCHSKKPVERFHGLCSKFVFVCEPAYPGELATLFGSDSILNPPAPALSVGNVFASILASEKKASEKKSRKRKETSK